VSGGIIDALQFAIDGVTDQTNAVANNLANANTPDFTDNEVNFQSSLASAIAAPGTATAKETNTPSDSPAGTNGNNVDLGQELDEAEQVSLSYQQISESLNFQFRLIAGSSGGSFT
jgi:flagellar basal-body rod protein FlgB